MDQIITLKCTLKVVLNEKRGGGVSGINQWAIYTSTFSEFVTVFLGPRPFK
jgi:hypothetical protein